MIVHRRPTVPSPAAPAAHAGPAAPAAPAPRDRNWWVSTTRPTLLLVLALVLFGMGCGTAWSQVPDLDPSGGARPVRVWTDQPDWVTGLAFLKDGRRLCVGTYEQLALYDVRHGSAPAPAPAAAPAPKKLALPPGYVKSLALSPGGKLLAAGHYQTVTLIDTASWTIKGNLGEHAGDVSGLAFSPDGRFLAVACGDEAAHLWSVADRREVRLFRGHRYPVVAVAFSPDGTRIATAAGDETRVTQRGEVKVWNVADGKEIFSFRYHHQAATDVAFSPDGKFMASTGFDERVILYDLTRGKSISYFAGHGRPTNVVLFAAGGTTMITAAGGRAQGRNDVKLWSRQSGAELATFAFHKAKVDALALNADETLLASGGYDKAVAVWDVKALLHEKKAQSAVASGKPPEHPDTKVVAAAPEAAAKGIADGTPHARPVRVGMIGLDTSHCGAFAKELNNPNAKPDVAGFRVVAAYPRGSADIVSSTERIPQYTADFRKMGIEIVDSIDDLLNKVDVVLLETNDGRPHLEQALAVMKKGKKLFIDKPIAGSLADAAAIFEAAQKYHVPVFSSSSLRFGKQTQAARNGKIGRIVRCETTSPCTLEKTHPDLFWYGIHGVESLFTVMGTGCKSVRRTVSTPTEDVVVGTWDGGRTGTFRGTRPKGGYSGTATGTNGTLQVGQYEGYRPLVVEIVKFFKTGVPPVSSEETLELYAFMEGADESKREQGKEIAIGPLIAKARAAAAARNAAGGL